MEKLTLENVKEMFKQRYANGGIFHQEKNRNKFEVYFEKEGKCYTYTCRNLLELCNKLNILGGEVEYKTHYNAILEEVEWRQEEYDHEKEHEGEYEKSIFEGEPDDLVQINETNLYELNRLKNIVSKIKYLV